MEHMTEEQKLAALDKLSLLWALSHGGKRESVRIKKEEENGQRA